jgi:hypothetical protein
MSHLIRKGKGQPLRAAMKRHGLTAPQLAKATKRVDVTGRGISTATVYKLTDMDGSDECRLRTAWLATTAMDEPLQRHFDMPSVSTDTVERFTPHGEQDPR